MRRAVAVVLAFAVSGCSIGDIRRPPPRPEPATTPAAATPTPPAVSGADEVRRVDADVPPGHDPHTVEFVDQNRGYVMFNGCDMGGPDPAAVCHAVVFATSDGARTWRRLRHPRPHAANHQLYASVDGLALLAEPHGYWISRNEGTSFTRLPETDWPVPAVAELFGRFQACCDSEPRRVVEFHGGRMRPVPTQPPIPSVDAVGYDRILLYAAGLRDGRPYAAVSTDQGQSWRATAVAGAGGERLEMLEIMVSRAGHAWLAGTTSRFAFPRLWLYDGQGWRPSGATGHPPSYLSAAPLADGSVAVSGPDGPGVVLGGAFWPVDWPTGAGHLRLLADGTIISQTDRVVWLGQGAGVERRWVRIELPQM